MLARRQMPRVMLIRGAVREMVEEMRKQIWILAILSVVLGNACAGSPAEEKAVRDSFTSYKEAILSQRGSDAVENVNKATIDYYQRTKDLALRAPEQEVRNLSTYDKMMVLLFRHRLPLDLLSGMNGRELFSYGVNRGWIGREDVMESDLGTIRVSGEQASAQFVKAGKPLPLRYQFTKEGGQWKLDLTMLAPQIDLALKELIRQEGLSEEEFLFQTLEAVSGKKVSPQIWQPPLK